MIVRVFLFILLLCVGVNTLESLCSNNVSDKKCLCKRLTNQATNLPTSLANCNGLSINEFPKLYQFPDDLTVLDLSMNNIQFLNFSSNNDILQKLILSFNSINVIEEHFFQSLPELAWLDLSHNNISSFDNVNIFLEQKRLVYLDLSYNNFKELPSAVFEPIPLLRVLDLSYNPLGKFLTNSKDVLNMQLGLSTNITHFKLNNVGLSDLHPDYFGQYQGLKHLEFQDNNLQFIPTVPYSVEYLDFSGNNLTFISARYLNYHSLKILRLSRMPTLVSIHHYAFYNLPSLESLIITDCPNIKEFTDLAFGLASKTMEIHPKRLILARNGLAKLNSTYKHMFRRMEHIDLRHNPWDCNCALLWMQEFNAELFKGNEIRCAGPPQLKRKRLQDLTHFDLPDCFPDIYGKTSHRVTIIILMATVIFLMGLIFYLIRYPKAWVNPRHIGIGPNSPYSAAPQDDVRF
ncbi:unnamed protein product [Ceutorhynchus assimilis]|uniref:LRRCT domain-containing protein n=1 Tax=Ceutorhynchus assimilis TaxID=467358 RepID=A0A9N9MSJ2_9CUCU|nr:unnamed protein product [Ceutorhynchus assimilis]